MACQQKLHDKVPSKTDVLLAYMDTTVSPSDDFFLYANGTWIKNNPIPGDEGSWGIGDLVVEENLARLHTICEKADSSSAANGTAGQKIGDFFSTAMDSLKIEQQGLSPLQPYLDKIAAIKDVPSFVRTSAELRGIGSATMFSCFVTQDDKQSDVMAFKLWQGGIGLPEREYYFKKDSATKEIRDRYVDYITTLLKLSGEDSITAAASAEAILSMETKMAAASKKIEDLRDPYVNYNKVALKDLGKLAPRINLFEFLQVAGVKNVDSIIIGQPGFVKEMNEIISRAPLNVLKAYLKFNLLSDYSEALPDVYGKANFNFEQLFTGAESRRPRWKRVIETMEYSMGEMMGQLFVKEYFPAKAKERYSNLVEGIRDALHDRISKLSWMSDSTKNKAYAKLAAIRKKVGYPDKWKDYSNLEIKRDSYLLNLVRANTWLNQHELNKLGKPVDHDEWDMPPQEYNAYYNAGTNEIVLPAGIFTIPGYRDEELDDAVVYGYSGASTIGHEITHGFDDEGRQYDEKGNLENWWTKADEAAFNRKAEFMIRQYDEFEPIPGYHINGKATLGENIADLGGILLGMEAFKKTTQFKANKMMAGLTPMQRFFQGYALGWSKNQRDEVLRNRLLTDVHSPSKYRVLGPLADVDEFYSTYQIKPGSPMFRPDSLRVRIW
jgi:putative endopeptidase